jgi:hypothetical protein
VWCAVIGGAVAVLLGLFALRFPVYIDDFDQWGWQINCGSGLSSNLAQAGAATNGTGFVGRCESALLLRRVWTIPMVVIGSAVFVVVLLASALDSLREGLPARADGT